MPTIYLLRHGETMANRSNVAQGQITKNEPLYMLTQKGVRQAKRLGDYMLQNSDVQTVYSSDLPRAVQTAMLAFPRHRVHTLKSLREVGKGCFEGRHESETWHKKTCTTNQCRESHEAFVDRVHRAISIISSRHAANADVAIVTHSHVIKAILDDFDLDVPNGAVYRCTHK